MLIPDLRAFMSPTAKLPRLATSRSRETAAVLALLMIAATAGAPRAATFTVDTDATQGAGSLEEAIGLANASPGLDRIVFAIPAAGVQSIVAPAGVGFLPITDPLEIDGYSQAGSAEATAAGPATILIELDGAAVTLGNQVFTLDARGTRVRGVAVNGSGGTGIRIQSNDVFVVGCHIGTDAAGLSAVPNADRGIIVFASRADIGGEVPAKRNVISGNGVGGIDLRAPSESNRIFGNYIGIDAVGAAAIPNTGFGIRIKGESNRIGADLPGAGNLISGNWQAGILVMEGGVANQIEGNFIGTDASGTQPIGNLNGIDILDASSRTQIGGLTTGARNVIAASSFDGIHLNGTAHVVQGNYIGTNAAGVAALPNARGMQVHGRLNLIGGAAEGAGNVISGNAGEGILIVQIGNQAAFGNLVLGNAIGVDVSRTRALGNGGTGVHIQGGVRNSVGSALDGSGNIIAANGGDGVALVASGAQITRGNAIFGNAIGTGALGQSDIGNEGSGVRISGGNRNAVGGPLPALGNIVAFNGDRGVSVESGIGHAILGNALYANDALEIDLGADGVTANDAGDVDQGANNLQNTLDGLTAPIKGADLHVDGTLDSTPNTNFRVEVFAVPGCTPLAPHTAPSLILTQTITTDAVGSAILTAVLPATTLTTQDAVVATVSVIAGVVPVPRSTSEFSACAPVTN